MNYLRRYYLMAVLVPLLALVAFKRKIPTVFLIGDSISIQYGPYLKKYLEGIAELSRKEDDGNAEKNLDVPTGANGGDSRMVLAYLRSRLKDPDFKPDFLLLNCGLHDIKRDTRNGKLQVEEIDYRNNLTTLFSLLKNHDIKPIWIRTPAVVDSIHNSRSRAFYRYAADLTRFNTIADDICKAFQVPQIDLHGFTWRLGQDQFIDHVHYSEPARALQAAFIAGQLAQIIPNYVGN